MEVNYLKIGNKVYAINEIQAEGIDVNAELKEFYEERHTQLADEFGQTLNNDMQQEWDTQIAHLRKFENKGAITVPANMYGKALIVQNNVLMPIRVVLYSPCEMTCTHSYAQHNLNRCDFSSSVWRNAWSSGADLIITFKPSFAIPMLVAYDKKSNRLYTPTFQTYHTMSGYSLCTGNHKASDFWALSDDDLEVQLNKINTFSPARREVNVKGELYRMEHLVNDDSVIEVKQKGEGVWRT